jgi:hypothetical protein
MKNVIWGLTSPGLKKALKVGIKDGPLGLFKLFSFWFWCCWWLNQNYRIMKKYWLLFLINLFDQTVFKNETFLIAWQNCILSKLLEIVFLSKLLEIVFFNQGLILIWNETWTDDISRQYGKLFYQTFFSIREVFQEISFDKRVPQSLRIAELFNY